MTDYLLLKKQKLQNEKQMFGRMAHAPLIHEEVQICHNSNVVKLHSEVCLRCWHFRNIGSIPQVSSFLCPWPGGVNMYRIYIYITLSA